MIPLLRTPGAYVEFDSSRAQQGPSVLAYTALIIGPKLAAGSAAVHTVQRVTSDEQAVELFGAGSILAQMCAAFRAANPTTDLRAVAVADDDAGVAATGEILFSGSATVAGTLALYIGGRAVKVGVTTSMTAADLATAVAAKINADTSLPVTAGVDGVETGQVNLTARHKGECHNELDVRLNYYGEATPAGITATVTAMSGGATNPELDDLIAALGDEWFNILAMPFTDAASLTAMETELARRWGPLVMIEGHLFTAKSDTFANLTTLGESRNSPHLTVMAAGKIPSAPWEVAACAAGVAAYFGQMDPARPFQTLPLTGILPPAESERLTREERDLLLHDGISTFTVDSGGVVRVERLISTYKENAAGAADTAYLDVNTLLTLGYLRFDWRNLLLRKYPRHKLANDGTRYGTTQAVVTPKLIKAEAIAWFRAMEELGLVEGIDQFKNDLVVQRNAQDPNRLDIVLPPDLVNQFRVSGTTVQFLL